MCSCLIDIRQYGLQIVGQAWDVYDIELMGFHVSGTKAPYHCPVCQRNFVWLEGEEIEDSKVDVISGHVLLSNQSYGNFWQREYRSIKSPLQSSS